MTIRDLINEITKLDLVLPEFQREYVWDLEQSKQLMVSLFKEYPTGSLLFWKTDNPPEIKNLPAQEGKVGTTKVILDGQQRLTTLYLLTLGLVPPYYRDFEILNDPRHLYFNIADGEFQYFQSTRMSTNPTWLPVVDCFTKHDKINHIAIAQSRTDSAEEALSLAHEFNENMNRLRRILDREYPIQTVPPSAGIDDAIDVFDRVNRLGTKLTDAELALAHISGKWPQARRVFKAKIEELEAKRFTFDLTFMVRSLTGVINNRALFDTVHATPRDALEQGWKTLAKILDYLLTVLPGRASIHSSEDLNTTNALVPVIVYLARHGMKFESDESLSRCIRWLYCALMWARYTAQTDQRLDHDIAIIGRDPNPWTELIDAIIDQRGRIEVKDSDFEGRVIQHPLYRMAYIVIKRNGAIDWFNGAPLAEPHGSYAIHSHHVFPTSVLYSVEGRYESENHLHKKLVNEIANRAFLTGDSNITLSNAKPADYLPKIQKKYPGALEKQFIPLNPDLWELDRYEDFLAHRRRLLADAINDVMRRLETPEEEGVRISVRELIEAGESQVLEFKASMRWDLRQQQVNKELERVIAKTVAGFLNAEGGTLLIGVADDKTLLGLEEDIKTIGQHSLDSYEQKLVNVLEFHLGKQFLQHLKVRFEKIDNKEICVVTIEASPQPVFMKGKGPEKEFYARILNTTRPFDVQEAIEYIQMHWGT